MACLLIGNLIFCLLLSLLLVLLALICLERSRSTQKPLADANRYLPVPGKRLLLAHCNPALALQRLPQSICCLLTAAGVRWLYMRRNCLLLLY